MGQYSDYYDSDEPQPIPNGYEWTRAINGSLERLDRSTQSLVQLFLDDGVAYAVRRGDVIAQGSDHGRVIQSALDWAATNIAGSSGATGIAQHKGVIDGGNETYQIGRQITFSDQLGLRNIDLNVGGTDLGGSAALRGESPSRRYLPDIVLENVMVRNNGNGAGIYLHQPGFGSLLRKTTAFDNAGDGIVLAGGVGAVVFGGDAKANDGDGYVITDGPTSHGNINRFYYVNASDNRQAGIHIYKDTQPGDDTDLNLIESANIEVNDGPGVHLDNGARSTTLRECWFETSEDLKIDGPGRSANWNRIIRCHTPTVTIGNAKRTRFIDNVSPIQYPLDLTITADATDTVVRDNRLGGGSITDNGTRTRRNRVGTNSGDPSSAGEWNGAGDEGMLVYDTSGTRPYSAYRYVSGQWQQA